MTWEYLIGSEKDFEGAPDWCTHVSESMEINGLAWEEDSKTRDGNRYQWVGSHDACFYENSTGIKLNVVAQRRKRESKAWDGVGMPPVGCECEALIPYLDEQKSQWRKVKVIFSGDELDASGAFIVVDLENSRPFWTDQFRPLRTKEQIERDDELKEIADLIGSSSSRATSEEIAEKIFNSGYRKTK